MSRTVIVGGSGDIGRVVVERLVAEGHEILVVGRDESRLEEVRAGRDEIATCVADVTRNDAGERIPAALGHEAVRMLVYMASAPLGSHILDTDLDIIRSSLEVKVLGLVQLVLALKFVDQARIVAVGGNLGFDPIPGASTAGIANAAQANLVRQLNRALAPAVTCHVVAPGPVETERYRTLARAEAERRGIGVEDVIREAAATAPLKRLTRPEEVAWAIARLADDEATALAGSTLLLDAGRRTAIP
jgi:3-oxoacyl-[acyl-carrier protein] reductase